MKNLLWGSLAVAAGIYIEKKYKVSEILVEQIKKYTGQDSSMAGFDVDDSENIELQ